MIGISDRRASHEPLVSAHGIVAGTAVNQDGRSSSLTAPNGPSQQTLIASCLRNSAAQPADVSYIAMHGTGTPLGDPIEVGALANALGGKHAERSAPLTLGSVKVTSLKQVSRSVEKRPDLQPSMRYKARNCCESGRLCHMQRVQDTSKTSSGVG